MSKKGAFAGLATLAKQMEIEGKANSEEFHAEDRGSPAEQPAITMADSSEAGAAAQTPRGKPASKRNLSAEEKSKVNKPAQAKRPYTVSYLVTEEVATLLDERLHEAKRLVPFAYRKRLTQLVFFELMVEVALNPQGALPAAFQKKVQEWVQNQ